MKPGVLVVEDQEMVMEQICDFLEWIGCEVVGRAYNGREAVKKYSGLGPDLVTMDLKMPVMDGAEATRRIISVDPEARILVFTSMEVDESRADDRSLIGRAIDNGALSAVCKFSKDGIMDEITQLFPDDLDL